MFDACSLYIKGMVEDRRRPTRHGVEILGVNVGSGRPGVEKVSVGDGAG